jgi:hypothetical protein
MRFVVSGTVIRRLFLASVFAATIYASPLAWGEDSPPEIPITSWLEGPARQDFPWQVELGKTLLSFQQRHYVQTKVTFRVRDLLKAGISLSDLRLIVRVAREDGRWLPGQAYTHFEPPPGLKKGDQISSFSGLYVRQGSYKVTVIAYDSAHRRGNLWHGDLRVAPLRDDPLPGIERDLPEVEFVPAQPALATPKRGTGGSVVLNPWTLGEGDLLLPVHNGRPVQVDIVTNVSLSAATDSRRSEAPQRDYQLNGAALLQISNVLSQLDLKSGCIRLSTLDVRRQKIYLDRQDVRDVDWVELQQAIASANRATIEAKTLAGEKREPAFLAHYLELLTDPPQDCGTNAAPPLHILILVSDAFIFPNGAQWTTVNRERIPAELCYHLRVVPEVGGQWDEIGKVVRPLHPVRFDFSSSSRFRKTLAHVMAGIEKLSQGERTAVR